ncbi:MAG TPA: peptidoglycan DD-metalloendopeptidase family protein [Longimicrobium sp.]|nr:peptidoglycan DD-metalloendopeptidase family protein [Longimicrobium sp.]
MPRLLSRASAALAPLFAALALAGCTDGGSSGTATLTTDRLLYDLRLDVPREALNYDRTWSLYFGEPVDAVRLHLSVAGLPAGGTLEVRSGDGTVSRAVTADGAVLDTLPGNVALLRLVMPGRTVVPPTITVDTAWIDRPESYTRPPAEAAALANRVTAFPLTPHAPVEVFLAPGAGRQFFFSVQGLSGPAVDLLVVGAGSLRVSSPENGGDWPSDAAHAMWTLERNPPGGAFPAGFIFRRLPLEGRTRLLFALTPEGADRAEGHARLVVLPVSAPQPLSFPSPTPQDFFPGVIGIDHDPADGVAGPDGGKLDCENYAGTRGYYSIPRPSAPAGAPAIPTIPGTRPPPASLDLPGIPVCYDGHQGMDYMIPGGQPAQTLGVPVSAARPGIVLFTEATHADDCFWDPRTKEIHCSDPTLPANSVVVRHDDGLIAHYVHLKTESVLVSPGTPVACGEKLGYAGSSGQSAAPHLHFELRRLNLGPAGRMPGFDYGSVRDSSATFDPFQANTWREIRGGMPVFRCS